MPCSAAYLRTPSVICIGQDCAILIVLAMTNSATSRQEDLTFCIGRVAQCGRRDARPLPVFGKSASDGFAAASNAVATSAARRAAGLVHRLNHAGFQQRARRGERDFVRRFVFRAVVPPFFRSGELRLHDSKDCVLGGLFASDLFSFRKWSRKMRCIVL
jgi:hypothetical protein